MSALNGDAGILRGLWSEAAGLAAETIAFVRRQGAASAGRVWKIRSDLLLASMIGAAAAAFSVGRFWLFDFSVLSTVLDLWFQGDVPRLVEANSARWSTKHHHTSVHPLFSLFVSLPLIGLGRVGFDPKTTTAIFVGASAFLFASVFYAAARALGLRRLDAIVTSALMLSTSAAMFWMTVPENYALGGATLLIPLIWLAAPRGEHDLVSAPVQSALALCITMTNWMAGLVAAVLGLGVRRGIWASALGFLIVVALTIVQQGVFPHSGRPFDFGEGGKYVSFDLDPMRLVERLQSLFSQSLLAPTPVASFTEAGEMLVSFGPTSFSAVFWIALAGWAGLCALAIEALLKRLISPRLTAFLVGVIAAQVLLHAFYGDGYFLYSLYVLPLLVLLAAAPCLGRRRTWVLALMALTALASGAHNLAQMQRATEVLNSYPERVLESRSQLDEQGATRWAMHKRPDDPWPNGAGHFVWGAPGAPLKEKGYIEPGGSLSPRPGAPGLSLWVYDQAGALEATSDQQASTSARHGFEIVAGDVAPSVVVETPYYRARWRQVASNRWRLNATALGVDRNLALSVRAVGPAAGPIHEIVAEQEGAVRVDSCWVVRVRGGRIAYLGEEGAAGWRSYSPSPGSSRHRSESGWAAARIAAPASRTLDAEVGQTCALGSDALWPLRGGVRVSPGDLPIATLIGNQTAHLLMGLEGGETRPGDPMSYPLQWLRDGGYTVVAMARAGRVDVARDLVGPFAELDFFGGFGSEADSPGISLWTLNEVAVAARDPALERALWPHVRRKADFILELLEARSEVRRPFSGPLTEARPNPDLVARAASNGLINGRMDWHEPVLFVNGFAWRGLQDAAQFADRIGAPADATRWREAAQRLRAAWRRKFRGEGLENPRTTASLLWPTRVAAQERRLVQRALAADASMTYARRPEWTYFEVARAHQYLVLGDVEGAWTRINSLMGMSAFADLGVLWEGRGGVATPGGKSAWRNYRGWVHGPPIMPHYWSAAEVMLFGLEGLAFVDETPERRLVIGAGIRREWLGRPIAVDGVGTLVGTVDWRWDGRAITVVVGDADIPLHVGPAFPAETRVIRRIRDERRQH